MAKRLVLASASPRRRELLGGLGLDFTVAPADVDEPALAAGRAPDEGAVTVAIAKARSANRPHAVVLAADTVVVIDGLVLGKPADRAEARAMLERLRGRVHEVITAVVVATAHEERLAVRRSAVHMREYPEAELARYVGSGAGLDKAGAYGIQDDDFRPVEAIDGCWCNVMGLPLWTASRLLAAAGCPPPREPGAAYARCAGCPLAGRGDDPGASRS